MPRGFTHAERAQRMITELELSVRGGGAVNKKGISPWAEKLYHHLSQAIQADSQSSSQSKSTPE